MTMKNLDLKIEGDQLIIKIDLTKDFGESKSGKSIIVATTSGNVPVEGTEDIKLGLNCYKPNK